MTEADDRRIWAYYRLQWSIKRIAQETGEPEDGVLATVNRIRQDPGYQNKLLSSPPPPGWDMFTPPGPGDSATPAGGWPELELPDPRIHGPYEGKHAARRHQGLAELLLIIVMIIAVYAAVVGTLALLHH